MKKWGKRRSIGHFMNCLIWKQPSIQFDNWADSNSRVCPGDESFEDFIGWVSYAFLLFLRNRNICKQQRAIKRIGNPETRNANNQNKSYDLQSKLLTQQNTTTTFHSLSVVRILIAPQKRPAPSLHLVAREVLKKAAHVVNGSMTDYERPDIRWITSCIVSLAPAEYG